MANTGEFVNEIRNYGGDSLVLSPGQEALLPLAQHLQRNIQSRIEKLEQEGHTIDIMGPHWCRENPDVAGQLHADIIVKTYGSTYALPNKDPTANTNAINEGSLDIYLLSIDNKVVGTTCLVNVGAGQAELGRSASLGKVGNTIIQDLRILDWLVNSEEAQKYHTLFATLRTAPDRKIDEADGQTFTMRGGQGVSAHWKKFPGLVVYGFGPLYLKHGELEQFSCAAITRNELDNNASLYLAEPEDIELVNAWHRNYGLAEPILSATPTGTTSSLAFAAHYPPKESGITEFVHTDIVLAYEEGGESLEDCIEEADRAQTPFTQIALPVDVDTIGLQKKLKSRGFQVYGYQPAYVGQPPVLLYGKTLAGVKVVPTFWAQEGKSNPFWYDPTLETAAVNIAAKW